MPIPPDTLNIITMLCVDRGSGDATRIEPVGTGFFVGSNGSRPGLIHPQLVTARHIVVPALERYGKLYARISEGDKLVDVPIEKWVIPDAVTDDIAVAPYPYAAKYWHTESFLSERDAEPYLGDAVYFIGLLKWVPEMATSNVPMVRSGTLGAMNQSGIPVKMPDNVVVRMHGHLIDCRAYRGFSGSPCFVQDPNGVSRLLGVVSAHFDASDQVPLEGDLIDMPIHAGVGVVTPVELLNQLLADERVQKVKDETERKIREQEDSELAATADVSLPDEFERFEDLTRKLVNIPKDELDEKRKGD